MLKLRKQSSRALYDLKRPRQRTRIADERNQLIGQMLEQKKQRTKERRAKKKEKTEYHCDTLEQY
jgi:hypothetical protein